MTDTHLYEFGQRTHMGIYGQIRLNFCALCHDKRALATPVKLCNSGKISIGGFQSNNLHNIVI